MKTTLALLLLTAVAASAQLVTNNVKVTLTDADDNALRLAWKLENNYRTNGIGNFTNVQAALTYSQFQDEIATEAFQRIAAIKSEEVRTKVNQLYTTATEADKAKVLRILSGINN
jgi:ribosomal protein L11 methylase PrmA